jgi:hypothetical protein
MTTIIWIVLLIAAGAVALIIFIWLSQLISYFNKRFGDQSKDDEPTR